MNEDIIGGPVYNSKIYMAGYDRGQKDLQDGIASLQSENDQLSKLVERMATDLKHFYVDNECECSECTSTALAAYEAFKKDKP